MRPRPTHDRHLPSVEVEAATLPVAAGLRPRVSALPREVPAPYVVRLPQRADGLRFSETLASVCALLSCGAAISREQGMLRATIRLGDEWAEIRLCGADLSIRSSSCALGNRILSRLHDREGAWQHDDALVRERAVETMDFAHQAARRRRGV
jgi:hypothetical protein